VLRLDGRCVGRVDDDDDTHVAQTMVAGFLVDHTTACLTWQETEKTDGFRGMHRSACHSMTCSRSDIHARSTTLTPQNHQRSLGLRRSTQDRSFTTDKHI